MSDKLGHNEASVHHWGFLLSQAKVHTVLVKNSHSLYDCEKCIVDGEMVQECRMGGCHTSEGQM